MNKSDIVNYVSNKSGFIKKEINEIVNFTFEAVGKALIKDGKVTIANFGTFSISFMPEHGGVNPRTLEKTTIPACNRVSFKAGKALKDEINKPLRK
jgi:DNA-binding protein HU-beta